MLTRFSFAGVLFAALLAIGLTGCGSKQKDDGLQKVMDEAVHEVLGYGEINYAVVPDLEAYGNEAVDALMKAIAEKPTNLKPSYSTILTIMQVEPARFEACKQLLSQTDLNVEVRKDAAEGLLADGAPDEAIEMAIEIATDQSRDPSIRSVVCYAMRNCKARKFYPKFCRALRRATNDPVQDVRQHAYNSMEKLGCR